MTDTAARLLRLLSLLQMPREWPGSELADRLGVTDRTVRRDVDRLRELGYPVVAAMGAAGGYRLTAGSALPPLVLDEDEAVAVAVGLRVAAGQSVAGIEDAAVRALTKLEQVLPAKLRRRVRVVGTAVAVRSGSGPTVDPEILTVLAAAVTNRERVRMRYHDADGAESRRHVEPLGVVAAGRRWYLVAYDLERDGWRSFRADRITAPQPTGARSTARELPAADAADYVAGRRTDWATPEYRVDVTIDAALGRVAGRLGAHPDALVAAGPTACRLVETRDDDPEWLATQLIALGVPFRIRDSPELDARLREIAARIAQAHTR
ncbi:transcriptional regulator [Nocardia neocaledoniensis NBRC 108232]|uniref:Putative DNA-binding transcriptional regulator YafY n=1 Tax=Nocardia neocaledoniensis TaxID=236511 RepID=A0A317N248_9NOCA|nr:YafY family protein [Nocardia neocaledoniensis]PWV68735.1 putative DNA-binding transcriptional regulator YafY [Nocardia neocaledoniensis]GEM33334.1 transcriptional regulator [Nocardia neocaledoniensis NBRC 108232]